MSSRNDQCAIAGTKGISDAVRSAINTWITGDLVDMLWAEYTKSNPKPVGMAFGKNSFTSKITRADEWKRYARGNDPNGSGFFRKYFSKEFGRKTGSDPDVVLQVLTNHDDTKITYVTFSVKGKLIYGGACNVPSAYVSQAGYNPKLKNTVSAGTETVAFVPFTAAQLQKLATQYEFGGGVNAIDRMFEERI